MPVYATAKRDVWRVRVWQRGVKRDQLFHGKKKDALAFEAQWKLELQTTVLSPAKRALSFFEYVTQHYLPSAATRLSPNALIVYKCNLGALQSFLGDTKLVELTTHMLEAYTIKRLDDGLRPNAVSAELKVFNTVVNHARKNGVACSDARAQLLPKQPGRYAEAWTRIEVDQLLAATRKLDPEILPMLLFMLNTGCRGAETVSLPVKHLDFERELIRIWPHHEGAGFLTKNRKRREVPMPPSLVPMLRERPGPWVFPRRDGGRYARFPLKRLNRCTKAAGLTGGAHRARHTYATRFLEAKPDIFLLGRILGHSSSEVTEIYGHLLPDHLQTAKGVVEMTEGLTASEILAAERWKK